MPVAPPRADALDAALAHRAIARVPWGPLAWDAIRYALTLLALLMTAMPIYWVFATSVKLERDMFARPPVLVFWPTFGNFQRVLGNPEVVGFLTNSVVVSTTVTALAVGVASLAAYTLARFEFPGSRLVALGILSARLVPGATMIIPYYALFQWLRLTDTLTGLILAYTGFSLPFACWMMYGFFLEVPADVEDSARIDGCSDFDVFRRIALPLALPGLGATAILVFLAAWNEFLFALVLAGRTAKTLPVYLATFISERTTFWGGLFAVAVVMVLPTLVLTLLAQRSMVRGLTAGAVKG